MTDKVIELTRTLDGVVTGGTVREIGGGGAVSDCFNDETKAGFVDFEFFAQAIDEIIAGFQAAIRKRDGEYNALKAELVHLESVCAQLQTTLSQKSPLKYLGVFKRGGTYTEGSFVTHGGGVWHANKTTREKPGDGNQDWQLAVKKGIDGRDGRDAIS